MGSIHKDNWAQFNAIALPLLLARLPRRRLPPPEGCAKNALLLDLKDNNEEEFAKERLQTNVYAGTPYGHPVLGTVAGIDAITSTT